MAELRMRERNEIVWLRGRDAKQEGSSRRSGGRATLRMTASVSTGIGIDDRGVGCRALQPRESGNRSTKLPTWERRGSIAVPGRWRELECLRRTTSGGGRHAVSRTRCKGGNECGTRRFDREPSMRSVCASSTVPSARSETAREPAGRRYKRSLCYRL